MGLGATKAMLRLGQTLDGIIQYEFFTTLLYTKKKLSHESLVTDFGYKRNQIRRIRKKIIKC